MVNWLRGLFSSSSVSSDDIVALIDGLVEPEAEMLREMLEKEGVPAFARNLDATAGLAGATGMNVTVFVKQSDLERAREIMKSLRKEG